MTTLPPLSHAAQTYPPSSPLKLSDDKYQAMAHALRFLAIDMVEQAQSGHPGAPMGMAEMATVLWTRHLRHAPQDPSWFGRDRFVLSNGHASALLYSLLHLTGYALSLDDLRAFRQLNSKTPGHPEFGHTPGVETTTGPLGQGLANAVGMALAQKLLAHLFERPGFETLFDHHTYAFTGDGCLMEGLSHEVSSLAGAWKLNRLIVLYDSNGISIDGNIQAWMGEDVASRFRAYGWQVIGPVKGHDLNALDEAIHQAQQFNQTPGTGPTLIICETQIGRGSPQRAGTAKAHGEPLGLEELARTRDALAWPHMSFEIPEMLKQAWDARSAGQSHQAAWQAHWQVYAQTYPDLAQAFEQRMDGTVPAHLSTDMAACLQAFHAEAATVASRKASQLALTQLVQLLPQLLGGSADLTGSNLTQVPGMLPLRMDAQGRVAACPSPAPQISPSDTSFHINYGVREFGMAAIMNGIALHGGFIPYGGTFLTFSDYSRNAIRMAALMKLRVIHVLTHDSVGLGEDGPTHQPIEQAASLRLIPGLSVWRPADTSETWVAWACALQCTQGPTALLLSRQNLPYLPQNEATLAAIARGGYVLQDAPDAKAVLIASGSEVHLSLQAQALLAAQGIAVRLVSMPSTTVFDQQEVLYRQTILPSHLPKIAIEMASPGLWWKYGCKAVVGLETYGASAPASVLLPHFGFTPERIAEVVQQVLCAP